MTIVNTYLMHVQNLLGHCSQHLKRGEKHEGPAVLGIAMVAMAEELGLEMAVRSLEHLLQFGEQNIRQAVPLALGLLCISNPKVMSFLQLINLLGFTFVSVKCIIPFHSKDDQVKPLIEPARAS